MSTNHIEKAALAPIAYGPVQTVENWFEELENRLIGPRSYLSPNMASGLFQRIPRIDLIEREKELCVRAELPGVDKDDLTITLHEESLTLHAHVKKETHEESGTYYRRELHHGAFQRTLQLPVRVNPKEAKATFKHGLLELIVPKNAEFQPTRVEIK
ncbi:MAG TPA: Hsp20/alpha crystallin family protein [Methylococcaceae bacterium]|nr:Hsp20/alpha crystallin family protein [Methylococcaceae bacterium]